MSADNWAICPKCLKGMKDSLEKAEQKLLSVKRDSYGQVEYDEFLRIIEKADNRVQELKSGIEKLLRSPAMREDYEISLDEGGVFSVSYKARCTVCGFEHVFKAHEDVAIE